MPPEPNSPVSIPSLHPDAVPLARDPQGRPLVVPANGEGWLVSRHTAGRPRVLLDPMKRPMVIPLRYSLADVDDILPPGAYKLELVDGHGELIEVVDAQGKARRVKVGLTLTGPHSASDRDDEGEDDEADDNDDDETGVERVGTRALKHDGGVSDLRYLLAANVRATRLAFEHNQRTLESGLRIAETLRESVQVLADSQAEIIKAVVSSRMPRNAAFVYPAMPPALPAGQIVDVAPRDADNGSEDDDEDEEEREPTWLDKAMPVVQAVAPGLNSLAAVFAAKMSGTAASPPNTDANLSSRATLSKNFELSDLNWMNAYRKAQAVAAAPAMAQRAPSASLMAQVMGDAALVERIMAIKTQLPPEDSAFLLDVVQQRGEAEQRAILDQLRSVDVSRAVALARHVVADLRAGMHAAATAPSASVPLARVAVVRVPAASVHPPSNDLPDEHLNNNATQE